MGGINAVRVSYGNSDQRAKRIRMRAGFTKKRRGAIFSTSARTFSTSAISRETGMDIIKIRFADEFEGLGSRVEQTIMGLEW